MNRRRSELQTLDLASWATVAWTELDATEHNRVRRHMDAIERSASGATVRDIETC